MGILNLALNANAILPNTQYDVVHFIKEVNSDGTATTATTADGTAWLAIGFSKDSGRKRNVTNFKQVGDSGKPIVNRDELDSYTITFTQLQRDANSRNLVVNSEGRYYQMVSLGQKITSSSGAVSYEVDGYSLVKFGGDIDYKIGGDGTQSITINTLNLGSSVTITLPTAGIHTGWGSLTSTTAVTVQANKQFVTVDAT